MQQTKVFQIAAIYFLLCIYFIHPLPLQVPNPDIGTHLLLGKIIFTNGNVPSTNLLTFSNPNFPFVNTTWLSEVIFYLVNKNFGFNGLIALSLLTVVTAYSLIFKNVYKKYNLVAITALSFIYLQILAERTEVRPELFSYLFLAIALTILYRYKEKYTRWIYALIPLQLLWINLHIYFIVGIVLQVLLLIDTITSSPNKLISKKCLTLIGVTIASVLATLCNPHFIQGALYPLFVFTNYGANVIENKNLFIVLLTYFDIPFIYYIVGITLLWLGIFINPSKFKRLEILYALFFTALAFFAIRNAGLFVFGTFMMAIKSTDLLITTIAKKLNKQAVYTNLIILSIVGLGILPAVYWNISEHGVGFGATDTMNNAVNFFTKNHLNGPIYNNYDIGSYLAYRLYPDKKVFVDGRPEAYPAEFFTNEYVPMELSLPAFNKVDKKYRFNTIIYQHFNQTYTKNQLLFDLVHNTDWRMVYLDSYSVIFMRNTTANKKIINQNRITQNTFTINQKEYADKVALASYSNFFRVIGWTDKMVDTDIRYLDFDPNNCVVLKQIVFAMTKQNNPIAFVYQGKYNQACQN